MTINILTYLLGCIDNYPVAPNQKFVERPDEDFDGDGFTEAEGDVYPDGTSADRDDTIYPNAPEICDDKDNDLNGEIDDDPSLHFEFYTDLDQDGFGVEDTRYQACKPFQENDIPFVIGKNDCDDNNSMIFPGALPNEEYGCYIDQDGDGYGDAMADEPFDLGKDCDDTNPTIFPGNARYELPFACVMDSDGDGYGDINAEFPISSGTDCNDNDESIFPGNARFEMESLCMIDSDGDGYGDALAEYPIDSGGDCDDTKSFVYPGSFESEPGYGCFEDADGDGFGDINSEYPFDQGSDCDDNNSEINTDQDEICDGLDNNCNQIIDGDNSSGGAYETPVDGYLFYIDADGDGYGSQNVVLRSCSDQVTTGLSLNNYDCDDLDATSYPNAQEYCDDVDHDCNGLSGDDYSVDATFYYEDSDGDGFGNPNIFVRSCMQLEDFVTNPDDCADGSDSRFPNAPELCNTVDDDCDGDIDELSNDALIWYADYDGDGYAGTLDIIISCSAPEGYYSVHTDCNDASTDIHPTAEEVCDGEDNDCDGVIDGDGASGKKTWFVDSDDDGFGSNVETRIHCYQPVGYVDNYDDCNDSDNTLSPLDEDADGSSSCDGDCDDSDASINAVDADNDGYTSCSGDCNDLLPQLNPSADEICDGIDNNCSGIIDDVSNELNEVWYIDEDSDGYGNPFEYILACIQPEGYESDNSDCDDQKSEVNPEMTELCETDYDDNCDGSQSLGAENLYTFYLDNDQDGYPIEFVSVESCVAPSGYSEERLEGWDCNDNQPLSRPGLIEYCNEIDDDCDGLIDELESEDPSSPAIDTISFFIDNDQDGYGDMNEESSITGCMNTTVFNDLMISHNNLDCDDDNDSIHPNASEICDETIDMNCDGDMTLGAIDPVIWYVDADNDQYGDPNLSFRSCFAPSGFIGDNSDCDDIDENVFPGALELCNGKLDDCSREVNLVDDTISLPSSTSDQEPIEIQLQVPLEEWDSDGDNFITCSPDVSLVNWANSQVRILDHEGYYVSGLVSGDDCDDTKSYVYPNAPETCNGQHDDCEEQLAVGGIPDDEYDDDMDGFVDCYKNTPLPLNNGIPEWFGQGIDENEDGISDFLLILCGDEYVNSALNCEEDLIEYYVPANDCNDNDINTYPGIDPNNPIICGRDVNNDTFVDCTLDGISPDYSCDYGIFSDNEIGPDFILIQGDDLIDPGNGTGSRYTIPHAFFIMTTPVTNIMYADVMETFPNYFNDEYVPDEKPVSYITWFQATTYANKISELQGLEMCYSCDETGGETPCRDTSFEHDFYDCLGYTLPSRYEFELATRSGTTKQFWTGDGEDLGGDISQTDLYACEEDIVIQDGVSNPYLSDYAWFCGNNYDGTRTDVAQKLPNGFGIYDTVGMVREWIHDSYTPECWASYPNSTAIPCFSNETTDRQFRNGTFSGLPVISKSDVFHLSDAINGSQKGLRLRRRVP